MFHRMLRAWFGSWGMTSRPSRQSRARMELERLEDRLAPAQLVVTSALDPASLTAGTLRYAVNQANQDAAHGTSDTILFNAAQMGSATITLLQGQLDLSGTGAGAETIDGAGQITVSGTNGGSAFNIDSGANVDLTGLTIAGSIGNQGTLTVNSSSLAGNLNNSGGIFTVGEGSSLNLLTVSAGTVEFDGNLQLASLNFSGGTFTGSGAVTVSGPTTWSGGTMSGSGSTILQGAFVLGGADGAAHAETLAGRTLIVQGAMIESGFGTLSTLDQPKLVLPPNAPLNVPSAPGPYAIAYQDSIVNGLDPIITRTYNGSVLVSLTAEVDHADGSSTFYSWLYTSAGALEKVTETISNPDGSSTSYSWQYDDGALEKVTETISNADGSSTSNAWDYTDGALAEVSETISNADGSSKSYTWEYGYGGALKEVTERTSNADGCSSSSVWVYSEGALEEVTETTSNDNGSSTADRWGYGNGGILGVSETTSNADGSSSSYEWDYEYGALYYVTETTTNADGSSTFSGWYYEDGALEEVTERTSNADGSSTSYTWYYEDGALDSVTEQTTNADGSSTSYTWDYDDGTLDEVIEEEGASGYWWEVGEWSGDYLNEAPNAPDISWPSAPSIPSAPAAPDVSPPDVRLVPPVPSAPTDYAVVTTPSNVAVGAPFAVTTTIYTTLDNTQDTTYTGNVTIALANDPNGNSSLGGTTTLAINQGSGEADFDDLTLNKPGTGFTLQVSGDDLTSATTNPFDVAGDHLAVTAQPPSTVLAGYPFEVDVEVDGPDGTPDTNYNGPVTLSLANNPGNATLGGTTTIAISDGSGEADFDDLTLNEPGTGYTLQASGDNIASTTTNAFDVTAVAANSTTTTKINAPAITYGSNGKVTVTVSSGGGMPTGDVSLTVDGGSPITQALSGGTSTFVLSGLNAGDYSLKASYAAQGNFAASSASGTLVVNQANASITVNGYNGVYDGKAHAATGTAIGVNGEDLSNLLSLGASFTDVPGGTANWAFAGNTDYAPASGTANIAISSYAFSYTIGDDSQTYGRPANLAADLGTTINTGVNGEHLDISYSSTGDTATAQPGTYGITGTLANGSGLLSDYSVSLRNGTLIVNAAPIITTKASPLLQRQPAPTFSVSASGSEQNGPGLASFDLYVSTQGGPFVFWTNVPVSNPSATFQGASSTSYAFYSIGRDTAGNVESKSPLIEAGTYVPDYTPPVTQVSAVNDSTSTFTVQWTGVATGGSGLAFEDVYAQVDGGTPVDLGHFAAGTPNGSGVYSGSFQYQAIADGQQHTYAFSAVGTNGNGIVEATHATPDISVTATYQPPVQLAVTSFIVQNGAVGRSFIRYITLDFNTSVGLQALISGGAIAVTQYNLADTAEVGVVTPQQMTVEGNSIVIDFGVNGVGVNANAQTTAGDGYYAVTINYGSGRTDTHHFYRLLGDVLGHGIVDSADITSITNALGKNAVAYNADVTGSTLVTAANRTLAIKASGNQLGAGLFATLG